MRCSRSLLGLCVLITILFNSGVHAQLGIRKGIKLGNNWATLTGDMAEEIDHTKGFTGGICFEFVLMGLFSLQTEILYTPRGAQWNEDDVLEKLELNYITVPFILKRKFFPFGIHPYILGGTEFGFLLSAKQAKSNIKSQIQSQDMGLILGAGFEFSFLGKSAYAEGRYGYGLDNIFVNPEDGDAKHRISQVFFGILF